MADRTADKELSDWTALRRGERLTLHTPTGAELSGTVDMRSDDASVIWVQLSDGAGRRLICREDGVRLRRG